VCPLPCWQSSSPNSIATPRKANSCLA
jgi:hypothetical protein